jgi:PhnB protein
MVNACVNYIGMPSHGSPRIVPYLAYADAPAALAFLCRAFGFVERMRYPMPDGTIGHAELEYEGARVYLASEWRDANLVSPRELSGVHCQIWVGVDDVEAHFERARAAGATIAAEPADQPHGERMYRAIDPEGHRWIFAQEL